MSTNRRRSPEHPRTEEHRQPTRQPQDWANDNDLGSGIEQGAARSGQSEEEYVQQFGELLTPEAVGAALLELVRADAATVAPAYRLTSAGVRKLP